MADLDIISHACPSCGHTMDVPAISAGAAVTCPRCKETNVVVKPRAAPAAAPSQGSGSDERRLFACTSCGYRARIPGHYVGMAVRCPNCNAPQIASGDENAPSTGQTVMVKRLQEATLSTPTPTRSAIIRPGHLLYTCNLCGFEAQFAIHYLNKAIRCPGCHAAQVVAEGVTAKLSPMTTPRNGVAISQPGTTAIAKPQAPAKQPLFICSACGYRARIPDQYLGMAVTCPSCDVVQIANAQNGDTPATGNTTRIQRMATATPVEPVTPASDARIPFRCPGCGFSTQIGQSLAGKAIRCPGCQSTQIVPSPSGEGTRPPTESITAAKASPIPAALSQPGGDKIRFICTACQFKARIPAHYAGQVIHCPGCHRIQLVQAVGVTSATGGTQTLNRVETAPGNRQTATAGDELPRVSSALEPSDTLPPASTARLASEDRNLQPTTETVARNAPATGTGSQQRPTTRSALRSVGTTGTGPTNRPATTSRITKPPVAAPVPLPSAATTPQAPAPDLELSPSTDRHRPGSAAIMPTAPRPRTAQIVGIAIAGSVLAILGLMIYNQTQLQQQIERLDRQRKEEQEQAKAAEDRRQQELLRREEAERRRADMEQTLAGLQDQLRQALERVARLQTVQAPAPVTAPAPAPATATVPPTVPGPVAPDHAPVSVPPPAAPAPDTTTPTPAAPTASPATPTAAAAPATPDSRTTTDAGVSPPPAAAPPSPSPSPAVATP